MLMEAVEGAAAVIAVGTCAAFGGLPAADPNPTGAVSVHGPGQGQAGRQCLRLSAGAHGHHRRAGPLPDLRRACRNWTSTTGPLAFFGQSIHDRCYRRPFYDKGLFAETFDDEGATRRLVPVPARLQGPEHLQRLRHHALELGHQLADRVRAPLPGLLRARLLGCRGLLRAAVGAHRPLPPRPCWRPARPAPWSAARSRPWREATGQRPRRQRGNRSPSKNWSRSYERPDGLSAVDQGPAVQHRDRHLRPGLLRAPRWRSSGHRAQAQLRRAPRRRMAAGPADRVHPHPRRTRAPSSARPSTWWWAGSGTSASSSPCCSSSPTSS